MGMRTGLIVLWGLLVVVGCGGPTGPIEDGEEGATSTSASEVIGVPNAARTQIRAACKGSYARPGSCVTCVARAAETLRQAGTLTPKQKGLIVASFAVGECHHQCIPTSCDIEGATCGSVLDLCGHELACGTCPSGQSCTGNVCVTPPPKAANLAACFCGDGDEIRVCADVDCNSNAEIDAVCGPACDSPHGGLAFTECFVSDPNCTDQ